LAVARAASLIRAGRLEAALAGGVDELDPLVDEVLGAMGAGDELRGEGAAFVVLEAEDAARARGARVLGELAGAASRALPARVGGVGRRATSRAIGAALEQAGLGTGEIGHVFTSASGDGQRNRWEEALLEAALAPHRPPRTSLATRVRRHAGAGPLAVAAARSRGASLVVTLDGDGQHDPGDLAAVLAAARSTPGTLVIGGRLRDPRLLAADRLNAIRVAGFFVNWASGLALEDTQSGFRAYPLAFFDDVRPRRGGFVFETEALVAAGLRGWPVREVPVTTIARAGRLSRF